MQVELSTLKLEYSLWFLRFNCVFVRACVCAHLKQVKLFSEDC